MTPKVLGSILFENNRNMDEGFKLEMIVDQPNIVYVVDHEVDNV